MAFWWVNHKQTRDHEVRGGYLWSPVRNANGAFNQTYENMRLVRPGDVVFSFAHARIGAIGHVTEAATAAPKPTEFANVGNNWSDEGWLVSVYFTPAPTPLRPKDHIEAIGSLLPIKHSPIQRNGDGNQGVYLAGISDALGHRCWPCWASKPHRRLRSRPSSTTASPTPRCWTTYTRSKAMPLSPRPSACS